jgi:hypothetical protein
MNICCTFTASDPKGMIARPLWKGWDREAERFHGNQLKVERPEIKRLTCKREFRR